MSVAAAVRDVPRMTIVPTGQDMGWLNAREAVKSKGGLPSHVLHDDYLVKSSRWKELPAGYYGAWEREVLVYPEKNGRFVKGQDVVDADKDDADKDDAGREWVLPASCVPEQAVGRAKVGLFIDPEQVEVSDSRVVILAKPTSIVVLDGFIQESGNCGKVDEATRIPLEVPKGVWDNLSDTEKRWLYRIAGAGVRPLACLSYGVDYGRQIVDAASWHDSGYGVAYVDAAEGSAPRDVEVVRAGIADVSRPAFRSAPVEVKSPIISVPGTVLDAAEAEYTRLATEVLQPTQLVAYRRLLDSLAIKE